MQSNFSLVKRGYDPNEVDDYILELRNQLKSYKDKDNAIKNALINAEIAADNIIKNAKVKALQITEQAQDEAFATKKDAFQALDEINSSIIEQKKMLSEFQKDYNVILNKYLKNIDSAEYLATFNKICALEDFIESLKEGPSAKNTRKEAVVKQQHKKFDSPEEKQEYKNSVRNKVNVRVQNKSDLTKNSDINFVPSNQYDENSSDSTINTNKKIQQTEQPHRTDRSSNTTENNIKANDDALDKIEQLNKISFDNSKEMSEKKDPRKHNLW